MLLETPCRCQSLGQFLQGSWRAWRACIAQECTDCGLLSAAWLRATRGAIAAAFAARCQGMLRGCLRGELSESTDQLASGLAAQRRTRKLRANCMRLARPVLIPKAMSRSPCETQRYLGGGQSWIGGPLAKVAEPQGQLASRWAATKLRSCTAIVMLGVGGATRHLPQTTRRCCV